MSVQSGERNGVEFLDYRIEELLGQGGMGIVYRAQHVRLKRTVALKLMAPELAADERYRERFARESELAMSLEHPNVVPIHDAGEFEGRLYLAMRHVVGTDLRTRLREGALAPGEAVAILKQVASALDAAHARGLVHRDVKPSNVLLDPGGHVYLADFGLTRRLSEQGGSLGDSRSLGTPAYLAPEQIEGGPVDGRADVYSLGCMLFECLTGTPPFPRGSRLAMVWAHLEDEPPRASERRPVLPEAVDAVLAKAMAKEPGERHATCAELAGAAEEALGLREHGRMSRRMLALTAAALLVAVALVTAALVAAGAAGDDEPAAAAASSAPVVKPDSLVRIDPETNAIEAVVAVDDQPIAAAAAGSSAWAYSWVDRTLAEIDPATNSVRHKTVVAAGPTNFSTLTGPALAADPEGAWLVGYKGPNDYLLTRVLTGGRGTREYRLDDYPAAVTVADGAAWLLTADEASATVLRLDPATGAITDRIPIVLDDRRRGREQRIVANGLAVAGGAAWVMDSHNARLYRVDLRSGKARMRDLGDLATPPVAGFGSLWICALNPGSSMLRVDPRTFSTTFAIHSIPAEAGSFAVGYGALWRHDEPSGDLFRFDPRTGKVAATIRISPEATLHARSPRPRAVAAGAGSVWIAVS